MPKFVTYEASANDSSCELRSWFNILPIQGTSPRHIGEKHYDTADHQAHVLDSIQENLTSFMDYKSNNKLAKELPKEER
jgi:hypothetical protein